MSSLTAGSVTVARPGFINFKLKSGALSALINQVLDAGDSFGQNNSGEGVHILVEWVSANPTGDLHCGHAFSIFFSSRVLPSSMKYSSRSLGSAVSHLSPSCLAILGRRHLPPAGKERL